MPASKNIGQRELEIVGSASGTAIILSFFMALQLIMGSYDGWWSVAFFAEEDVNPGKNIPRSLFIGTTIILLVYVFINAAFFYVVPVSQAAGSPLLASDAAETIFGKSGSLIIILFSLLSLISILNAHIMIPSRILFGLSRDRFFFSPFAYVNKGGTAVFALLLSFAIQFVLIILSSFEQLFGLSAYLSLLVLGLSLASLIKLRFKEPELSRPYRAWGYPYTTLLSIVAVIAVFIGFTFNDQQSILIMTAIILVSIPCYYFLKNNAAENFG
jgi:APA family basic amino acid/polyamine antiporter